MSVYTCFLKILNMSITASIVILAVFLVRLMIRRAPRIFSYLLWGVVLLRLLCPVNFHAPFGLFGKAAVTEPKRAASAEIANHSPALSDVGQLMPIPDLLRSDADFPEMTVPPFSLTETEDAVQNTTAQNSAWSAASLLGAGAWLWILGVIAMIIFSGIRYTKLRRSLIGAVSLKGNLRQADHISSPFVLGLFRPVIYLPSSLAESETEYVLAHERHHIFRLDPLWRLLSYAALCIHWFNPLVWAAFFASRKDMEISCDEAVIRQLGKDIRASYSESLLRFASGKPLSIGAPLAFGEDDTKARILNVMKYQKPAVWLSVIATFLCAGAICVLAFNNPDANQDTPDPSYSEPSSDTSAPSVMTWTADWNNDGQDEVLKLDVSELNEMMITTPRIETKEGALICELPEIGTPHVGWGTYSMTKRDGKTLLFSYESTMFQGDSAIGYTLYTLEGNELKIVEQAGDLVNYLVSPSSFSYSNDVDAMLKTADRVNELWAQSRLLYTTNEDLYGLYTEDGTVLDPPESILCADESLTIRYREEYSGIRQFVQEMGRYRDGMSLKELLETHNKLMREIYDYNTLITGFIQTVNAKDVNSYIDLFASDIKEEMNTYIKNRGTESFFQEDHRQLLKLYTLSDSYVESHAASFDDIYSAGYPEVSAYYVTELVDNVETTHLYLIVPENGERKLYRISATPAIDEEYLQILYLDPQYR